MAEQQCAPQEGLAQKLDKDLDEYIEATLKKNADYKYTDGLTEENFDEVLT